MSRYLKYLKRSLLVRFTPIWFSYILHVILEKYAVQVGFKRTFQVNLTNFFKSCWDLFPLNQNWPYWAKPKRGKSSNTPLWERRHLFKKGPSSPNNNFKNEVFTRQSLHGGLISCLLAPCLSSLLSKIIMCVVIFDIPIFSLSKILGNMFQILNPTPLITSIDYIATFISSTNFEIISKYENLELIKRENFKLHVSKPFVNKWLTIKTQLFHEYITYLL